MRGGSIKSPRAIFGDVVAAPKPWGFGNGAAVLPSTSQLNIFDFFYSFILQSTAFFCYNVSARSNTRKKQRRNLICSQYFSQAFQQSSTLLFSKVSQRLFSTFSSDNQRQSTQNIKQRRELISALSFYISFLIRSSKVSLLTAT